MKFVRFPRDDSAMRVVPRVFQPPVACGPPGSSRVVGAARSRIDAHRVGTAVAHAEGDGRQLRRPSLPPVAVPVDACHARSSAVVGTLA